MISARGHEHRLAKIAAAVLAGDAEKKVALLESIRTRGAEFRRDHELKTERLVGLIQEDAQLFEVFCEDVIGLFGPE